MRFKWLNRTRLMQLRTVIVCAIGLLAAMQTGLPDPAGAVQLPKPDKLVLAGLLIDGEFAELERRLAGYQEQFEAGQITDYRVGFAFSAFANSDPRVTRGLGRWVEESPDSYVPYLARSVHHANLAKHVPGRIGRSRSGLGGSKISYNNNISHFFHDFTSDHLT